MAESSPVPSGFSDCSNARATWLSMNACIFVLSCLFIFVRLREKNLPILNSSPSPRIAISKARRNCLASNEVVGERESTDSPKMNSVEVSRNYGKQAHISMGTSGDQTAHLTNSFSNGCKSTVASLLGIKSNILLRWVSNVSKFVSWGLANVGLMRARDRSHIGPSDVSIPLDWKAPPVDGVLTGMTPKFEKDRDNTVCAFFGSIVSMMVVPQELT